MDKNFILEFIQVYRSLPALWNVKSRDYSNRNLKNEQYETLLKKYNEKYPEATKKELSQKINALRTNYRRELKRMSALIKRGESEPSPLFYFDAMNFLCDCYCPSTSETNKENPKTSEVGPSSSNACTGLDNASIEEQPVDKIDIKDETYYFPSYGNSPSASQLDDYSQEEFRPPQISDPKKCNKRKRQIYEDDLSNPDLMTLKKNKLQLEIYNLRLDALKKEIDLGLPRSQFTEELYKNWDDVPIKEET
ncbi:uncharacterized protein LOC129911143 isoform X3 [Episyrphus balteatus]|uniref:uncharacterized protein LOC129911143 isoform X3 n=1 Tax=Episyrphus balteatus TaxID=286459 RepID=UPI00248596B9|nr:uncharacterized protein LOC129911143 isoform X3 [Episyrphus balteatus]